MKRYLLFVGENYYPQGGWLDFHNEFDSVKEAEDFVTSNPIFHYNWDGCETIDVKIGWAHVLDTTTSKIVWRFYQRFNETTRHCESVWGP